MTNETRKVEILTKHDEYVDKIEKLAKGFRIVLKPNTKVAAFNGGLFVDDEKGLAECYSKLKRVIAKAGAVENVSPAVKKEVKPIKTKKTTELGDEIQLVIEPEVKPEPKPLDPIKRPRRVV